MRLKILDIEKVTYRPDIVTQLLDLYAGGETLTSIGKIDGMPTRSTIWKWSEAYPEFRESLTRAREAHADSIADEVISIADDERDPQKARNRIEARKWSAGVHNPARYSPKIDLNITERVDLSGARAEARKRMRGSVRDLLSAEVVQVIDSIDEDTATATDSISVDTNDDDIFL